MKLLLIDDKAVVREGVKRLCAVFPDIAVLEAKGGREALEIMRVRRPEMVIVDFNLPGCGGLDLLHRLLLENPRARILIFSVHSTPLYVSRAFQIGAMGYVSKAAGADELLTAIRQVMAGDRYIARNVASALAVRAPDPKAIGDELSARELDIMRLLADGQSLAQVADALGISYKTVANNCTDIKQKLQVESTNDLIRLAIEMHASG